MKIQNNAVVLRGLGVSGIFVARLVIGNCLASWAMILLLLPLAEIIPDLAAWEWLTALPSFVVLAAFIIHFLAGIYTVIMEQDRITLRWWGINLCTIPVSKLQLFCAVGNQMEDVLCFSCHSLSEIADIQEKRLLKSVFKKHAVPFRKQHHDWQGDFAREYFNHLRMRSFFYQMKSGVITVHMKPELQYLLHHMYPQLPYWNWTGVGSAFAPRYSSRKKDEAVCLNLQLYLYRRNMESDGIHILSKKDEMLFIPAEQIKSIVRVDIFKAYERYFPHHMPLLFVSCSTEEELAAQLTKPDYRDVDVPQKQALRAMMAAKNKVFRWTIKDKDCCVLHYTEENVRALQQMCPSIQINTISEHWLHDMPGQSQ